MEKTLEKFGFKKNGLYSWSNEPFHVAIYFDGITITEIDNDGDSAVIYDGIIPKNERDEIALIEHYTKLKIINKCVVELLDSTKATRIFSNTSLYISNLLINYFKYNGNTEDEICRKLNIDKETMKQYLTGSYDFKLSEISNISVLVGKAIYIK
jgi:hypothetical protein